MILTQEVVVFTGGLIMTRFDSRLVYEQLVRTVTVTVPVSGNVASNTVGTWASAWYDMLIVKSTVRADVYNPGQTFVPATTNAKFQVPCQIIYSNTSFLSCYPVIEVVGSQWRCVITVYNNYPTVEASPNRTFTFTVSEYLPPQR